MSLATAKMLADLGLVIDGVPVLQLALRLEIAILWTEGAEVLDFYRRARAALGDRLSFIDTGSGQWKKVTPKTDPMVTTWCEQPVPFPKKLYFCTLQGADRGITDASLTIDFAMRPYEPPTSAKLAQWRNPEFHPNQRHSGLEVTFPLEHPLAEPEYFVSWVNELAALKSCRFISGTAGYGIDFPENAPTAAARTQSRERAGALLQRYPGLDLAGRRTGSPILLRRDMDYLGFTGMAVGKPYLKRANWLNFLSEGQVAFLGGLPALRKQLAPLPAIKIVEFAHGIMIQAGQRPQLGDITVNRIPAEYAAVAKAVAPVRVPSMNPSSMGDWFGDEGANLWLNALERI